jgi:hypothetical protein
MFEQMRSGRVSVLQELVNLPIHKKMALGIAATAGEIAQQPETWKTTTTSWRSLKPQE